MVTKKEIAEALNISRGTVSQVLNNTPGSRVSPQMRQRIMEQAQRMGYRSETVPASPSGCCIAYMFYWSYLKQRTYPGGWHMGMLYAFQQIAARHGQQVLFIGFNKLKESMNEAMHLLHLAQPQAIVLDGIAPAPVVETLLREPWPVVTTGAQPCAYEPQWEGRLSSVAPNNDGLFRRIIESLLKKRVRRIGIHFDSLNLYHSQLQMASYRKALKELGLPSNPRWELVGAPRMQAAANASSSLPDDQCMDGFICTDYHLTTLLPLLGKGRFRTLTSDNIALYSRAGNATTPNRGRIIIPSITINNFATAAHRLVTHLIRHPGQHRRVLIMD